MAQDGFLEEVAVEKTPRILYLVKQGPQIAGGGHQRSHLIYQSLRQLGSVTWLAANDGSDRKFMPGFESPLEWVETGPYPRPAMIRAMERRLGYRAMKAYLSLAGGWRWRYRAWPTFFERVREVVERGRFDLAVVRYVDLFANSGISSLVPTIVDVDDVEFEVLNQRISVAKASEKLGLKYKHFRLSSVYKKVVEQAAARWVVKESDRKWPGLGDAVVLPNIPFCPIVEESTVLAPPAGRSIMFVGSMDWGPNEEAVRWFLQNVWPSISKISGAEFRIISRNTPPAMKSYLQGMSNVHLLENVPDLSEEYRRCRLAVAPIWSGAGSNIKVIEAVASGRPCVVTEKAYRGYEAAFPTHSAISLAPDAKQMIEVITRLLEDDAEWLRRVKSGLAISRKEFSFARFSGTIVSSVSDVLSRFPSKAV